MLKRIVLGLLVSVCLSPSFAADTVFKIYLDADRTNHNESARSIEMGFRLAFDEVGNQLAGKTIEFVTLDHRGNVKRSYKHMQAFNADPQGLAYVAGVHSPPLIKYRDYINASSILTLVPWAAGAPITRHPVGEENYVFRLSVDDTKASKVLVNTARASQCQNLQLLLENTGWGRSNERAVRDALPEHMRSSVQTTWFNWGIRDTDARLLMRELVAKNVDCVLLVSNVKEGELLIEAASTLGADIQILSHWGITAGDFSKRVDQSVRESVQLSFVQSCFNFHSSEVTDSQLAVLQRAQLMFPSDVRGEVIEAPAGFVHGYDLAKVFIAAASDVQFGDDKKQNSKQLKLALESLQTPVKGLIKTYRAPFSRVSAQNIDGHEALDEHDLCMAMYDEDNAVKILPRFGAMVSGAEQ